MQRGTEPTERVNIVIVIERDLKRELCRERDRERVEKKSLEKSAERERGSGESWRKEKERCEREERKK